MVHVRTREFLIYLLVAESRNKLKNGPKWYRYLCLRVSEIMLSLGDGESQKTINQSYVHEVIYSTVGPRNQTSD